ncbi:MAG: sigma factor-like helix-turn-helix DNA-binding protein [Archangium sp.]
MWRTPDAERILVELHQQGVNAWPAIDLPLLRFSAHVEAVSKAELSLDELAKLSGEGLTLAAACLERQSAAISIFESVYLAPLSRVLQKLDGGPEIAADVLQRLRAQFFAPTADARSSFLAYSGGGALAVWLKVVAVREAQKLRRGAVTSHLVSDDALSAMPTPEADPELRFMKLQHRAHFKVCFQDALAALGKRERSVLRMSLVEGLSIDDIGKVYDVHRATAARWLTSAREQLVNDCRAKLAARLNVSEAELDELMGSAQSNLSISLGQLSVRRPAEEK